VVVFATMNAQELLLTAARALAVYVLMLVVIRALGRRTVGNFAAFDLLVALMLGEVVDEIIYGDVRFIQGAVAIIALGAIASLESILSYIDHGMEAVLEGKPVLVVKNGDYHRPGMRRERMNEKDVLAALRMQGVRDMRQVQYAVVEHDGTVSVVPYDWAEPVIKADIDKQMSAARDRALGGKEKPPPWHRSDSPQALEHSAEELR
jgi:uncharacterized membrane protein YcaP (DUF421 family)